MAGSRRLNQLSEPILAAAARELDDRPLVVALSGGADSAAAAWAVANRNARAIHIHHGWPHSDKLAGAAQAVAESLGLALDTYMVDVPSGASPENLAREARYAALESHTVRGEVVLTAHTADDQAETVLANLARGTGLDGLAGIPAIRGRFVRPFLSIRRAALRELAMLVGLPFLDDPSNHDDTIARVRVRQMLGKWERAMDRPLVATIGRAGGLAAADAELLDELAGSIPLLANGDSLAIATARLTTAPEPVAGRAVRRALRRLKGGPVGTRSDVDDVLAVARRGGVREIGGGVRVTRVGQRVVMEAGQLGLAPPDQVSLPIAGTAAFGSWRVRASVSDRRPVTLRDSRRHEVFDADAIDGPLTIRAARPDDGLAMGAGTKRVGDALSEFGVAADERSSWPIIVSDSAPLWVPDVRRAALGWVTPATRRYLVLSASREERWTPVES